MTKSKRSSASPPEFFSDRCLGKGAPRLLSRLGWKVHILGEHFPDDGQNVSDPAWMEYGLANGWSLLTQDMRIAVQPAAISRLYYRQGLIFSLASAALTGSAKADWFHSRQPAIYQLVNDRRVGFYVIPGDRPAATKSSSRSHDTRRVDR